MKPIITILLILALLLVAVVGFVVAAGLGHESNRHAWAMREEAETPSYKRSYEEALALYTANKRELESLLALSDRERTEKQKELADLNAQIEFVQGIGQNLDRAQTEQKNAVDEAFRSLAPNFKQLGDDMGNILRDRVTKKEERDRINARLMENVAKARSSYAEQHENFLLMESNQYGLQEELERAYERIALYRWARPDLQEQIGDNGRYLEARVVEARGGVLTMDKGRDQGVSLYQYFNVHRAGRIVAQARVTSVANGSAELEAVAGGELAPAVGDTLLPRRFISTFSDGAMNAGGK